MDKVYQEIEIADERVFLNGSPGMDFCLIFRLKLAA
jgi:hypothetical protein